MKRLTALLVLLGALVAAAPASAHTLTATRAGWHAKQEAIDFADEGEAYAWGGCVFRSAHQRRCTIASYDGYDDMTCDAYVYITFVSATSRRTRASSWKAVDCYEGDEYELAEYADGYDEDE